MNIACLRSVMVVAAFGFSVAIAEAGEPTLDEKLQAALEEHEFPCDLNTRLEEKLGREVDINNLSPLALLGRDLFFDKILSLSNDNSCAGCHSPRHGFGDTQSIAIGVENNDIVGPNRCGPRNQRRSPMLLNNSFYPKLMWNGRFSAISGDPFDNSLGFEFPPPEGAGEGIFHRFPADDDHITHLLMAQAQIPPTELPEMAGFKVEGEADCEDDSQLKFRVSRFGGRKFSILPAAEQIEQREALGFPDRKTEPEYLPHAVGGFFNEPIRGVVLLRLNNIAEYRNRFKAAFPEEFAEREFITFEMVGAAIAEFEFALTFVNAPIDQFARGDTSAMTESEKKGALLFFGKARCVECHAVAGHSNGMFSDFENHVIGVPQLAPRKQKFGGSVGNVPFFGPGKNEDFGLEDITQRETDRYKFRTSPLRNITLQPTFGHNGAWTGEDGLEHVIRHHLNPYSARSYDPAAEGVDGDLRHNIGPIDPVLARLSPRLSEPIELTEEEFQHLFVFVRDGLHDPNAAREALADLIPDQVPSGKPLQTFEE